MMKKVKLLMVVFVVAILLSGFSGVCHASYQEYNTGNLGSWLVVGSGGHLASVLVPGLTSRDSIIQVSIRYRLTGGFYDDPNTFSGFVSPTPGYNGNWFMPSSATASSGTWSPVVTYDVTNTGGSHLVFYSSTHDPDPVEVEVTNIKYLRYSMDGVNLSINPVTGYVDASIINNTPNSSLTYQVKNLTLNTVVGTANYNGNSTITFSDTGAQNGKGYSYAAYWGFGTASNYISMGNIFVPMDHQLTEVVNTINANTSNASGNTIGAVRDASGTALSEARQAKTNSQNASTYASQANTNALNAYNTAQTVNTKIDSLSTAVINIQNNLGVDKTPPEVIIKTVSGAQATSGSHIRAVVDASDNVSTAFWYSLDGIVYDPLPADGEISLPVYFSGNNLITVWVKDEAGNIGRNSITIRKL